MTDRPEPTTRVSVCCDASAAPCDVTVVEVLLRLKLAALRAGCPLRVEHASQELRELIGFMGLDDVLTE